MPAKIADIPNNFLLIHNNLILHLLYLCISIEGCVNIFFQLEVEKITVFKKVLFLAFEENPFYGSTQ